LEGKGRVSHLGFLSPFSFLEWYLSVALSFLASPFVFVIAYPFQTPHMRFPAFFSRLSTTLVRTFPPLQLNLINDERENLTRRVFSFSFFGFF